MNKNRRASEDFLSGTTPVVDDDTLIDKAVDQLQSPVKPLSYFERRDAVALGKQLTPDGRHIDLNENAERTSVNSSHQRQNRNSLVNQVEKSRPSAAEWSEGAYGLHARYCKTSSGTDVQGRTSCPVCHGAGFHAFEKVYAARKLGKSVNSPREDIGTKV